MGSRGKFGHSRLTERLGRVLENRMTEKGGNQATADGAK
jgi:hypothetical protein